MARRGVNGQLNMFDFIKSLEVVPEGEVEMVSLMPVEDGEYTSKKVEPEPVVKAESTHREEVLQETVDKPKEPMVSSSVKKKTTELEPVKVVVMPEAPVMSRSYEKDGVSIEIAYLKYNKVRIQRGTEEAEIKVFGSSKEAVDYYVEQMQELEADDE